MEKAFFIECSPRLFGMLFLPEPAFRKQTAYLVIHPFAEEKKSAHRTLVELSRQLYQCGYPVFMFDLRGCGDSEGDFGSVRLSEWLTDIHVAAGVLKSTVKYSRLEVLALRFGAFIAQSYDRTYPGEIAAHLWIEPVLQPMDYLRKSLRQKLMKELCTDGVVGSSRECLLQNLQEQKSIDFDGYEIGSNLYHDLVSSQKQLVCSEELKGLLISVSLSGKMNKSIQETASHYPNMKTLSIQMDPFWSKIEDSDPGKLMDAITKHVKENSI